MPITAQCPGCNQTLSVNDEFAGMQGKCPTCGAMVTFPSAAVQAAAPPSAPAPPPADFQQPPPAAYSQPPAWDPGAAGYAPPIPRDNTELFTLIGIGAGTFFMLLLFISTFLRWMSVAEGPGVSGTFFGDGRLILLFSLLLTAGVGLNFLNRRFLPLSMVVAGAFATFAFVVLLAHIGGNAGAGIYVALVAALGVMGACIWTAVRFPLLLDLPGATTQPAFTRTYGALLGAETLALVLGLIYWILWAVS
jgi:hypothetical protein